MKTRILVIDAEVKKRIDVAVAQARENPTPLEEVMRAAQGIPQGTPELKLADRPHGYKQPMQPQQVLLTNGYRAAISFEQQPLGLCAHLSVSVDTPGNLPSPESVEMIAKLFGLSVPLFDGRDDKRDTDTKFWTEEFDPGHEAVNIVQVTNG